MTDDRCDLICIDAPRAEAIREKLLVEETAQEAADRARALSDPTRLTLATALREGEELCVCDLSWISGRAQNLVSHHLRMLRSYGMVRSRRDGKLVMYSLTGEGHSLLGANALFGLWWADPVTALVIAGVAVREGRESWRGESCCAAPVVAGARTAAATTIAARTILRSDSRACTIT